MKELFVTSFVRICRWSLNVVLWVVGLFLGEPPENVNGASLDPDLQVFLAFRGPFDPERLMKYGLARGRVISSFGMRVTGPQPVNLPTVEDRSIHGPEGEIPIRVYDPEPTAKLPGCLFYHGGGFVLGDLDSHDGFCRLLARDAKCRVIAVNYRRAPEHRFPAALEDAVASFRWTREHAQELNIDPDRIAVAGDSAGGTLATVVCQHQIRDGKALPSRQLLMYPSTDMAEDYSSRHQENEQVMLPWEAAGWFAEQYVSEGDVEDLEDHRISPLRFDRLDETPPAVVGTAGFDPLRDEGLAYVDRMKSAGVSVRHQHYENQVHGFITFAGISEGARQATEELVSVMGETGLIL